MAGITVKTVIPQVEKALKASIRDAATEAVTAKANQIKSKGRAMIRGSYNNMGGLANAFRVTVLPKDKKSVTPAIIASVNTPRKIGSGTFSQGYSKVFDKGFKGQVPYPIEGQMWIPFPEARRLMGRKRMVISQFKRQLKFVKMGDTLVAMANVAGVKTTTKKFRTAKNPRLIKRATRNDVENLVPIFFLAKQVRIAPQWELESVVRNAWNTLAADYSAAVRKRLG
jgi:hypothetical protein